MFYTNYLGEGLLLPKDKGFSPNVYHKEYKNLGLTIARIQHTLKNQALGLDFLCFGSILEVLLLMNLYGNY